MDLFVINRFGVEENTNVSEEKNFTKLLSRIEKKKKQKLTAESGNVASNTEEPQEELHIKSKKHSKSHKLETGNLADDTEEPQEEVKAKKSSKSPKRSKLKVDEIDKEHEDDSRNVSEDLDNSTLPNGVKKKKRQRSHDVNNSQENVIEEDISAQDINGTETSVKEEKEDTIEDTANDLDSQKNSKKKKKLVQNGDSGKFTTLGEQTAAPIRKNNKGMTAREELLSAFPKWLSEPTLIVSHFDTPSHTVKDIPLVAPWLVEKLQNNGIKHFFPVQCAVIPAVLESSLLPPHVWPRDFCVSSPTGSGKTLAFVLPIVQALVDRVVPAIRALVVLPTQDLAAQVARVFRQYVIDTPLRVQLLGGKTFETEQRTLCFYAEHKKCYESRVDILVTTPGRLVEHLNNTPGFLLHDLQYLVVDEADMIIERSQHDWMVHLEKRLATVRSEYTGVPPTTVSVLGNCARPPHRLYFSATLSHDPEVLSKMRLFQPRLFGVAHFQVYDMNRSFTGADGAVRFENSKRLLSELVVPRQLEQFYVQCDLATKPLQLFQLVMANDWDAVIVFANSVDTVHRLVALLRLLGEGALAVAEISSSVTSDERQSAARDFARGQVRVLVSTDSFARGIDLPYVKCVISYDVPLIFQIYVHRVGRTCRAGRPGCAITLVDSVSAKRFYSALSFFRKRKSLVKMDAPESSEELKYKYQDALKSLQATIAGEKLTLLQKRKDVKKRRRNEHAVKRLQNASKAKTTLNSRNPGKKVARW